MYKTLNHKKFLHWSVTLFAALSLFFASSTSILAADGYTVSLRASHESLLELEINIGKFGISVSTMIEGMTYVGAGCTTTLDKNFAMLRYMPSYPNSGMYYGYAPGTEVLNTDGCGINPTPSDLSVPVIGYIWVGDSGLNLDLGLRPGLFAVGYSF